MKKKLSKANGALDKVVKFLGTRLFFVITIVGFSLQAGWLAVSSNYPMISDESYHYEIIRFFSKQWSPFVGSQTAEFSGLGDLTRLGSFVFHYLMSFPLRLVAVFFDQRFIQVVALRFVCIMLVVLGLYFFRKLFLEMKISPKATNLAILATVSIPIFPLISVQINYDNGLFLILPLVLIYALRVVKQQKNRAVNLLIFASLFLIAPMIKFTFFPILVVIVAFVGICIYRQKRQKIISIKSLQKDYSLIGRNKKMAVSGLFIISSILFLGSYGVNIIKYQDLTPNCSVVQPISVCERYYPWARSEKIKKQKTPNDIDPVRYTMIIWLNHISNNTFTAAAKTGKGKIAVVASPITIYLFAWAFFLSSTGLIIYYWRELQNNIGVQLFAFVACAYTFSLWANRYIAFRHQSVPIAMQPRYLLIIMPLFFVVAAMAWQKLLVNKRILTCIILLLLIFGASQGGGILTHLASSEDNWVVNRSYIIDVNRVLSSLARDIVNGE